MTLPLIPQDIFLALMIALQVADAWTTYDGIRAGASEANPLVRELMRKFGVREALWIIKLAAIAYFVLWPITNALGQWVNVIVFAGIAGNNYRILRKLRSQ